MVPKLKDRHIGSLSFSAMQVNLAEQVLSHSVAAGISALVTLKHLPGSAKDTAQFVEHFDGLFNTFNSWKVKTSQRLGHAFSDRSGHLSFLKESLEFLDKVKTSHSVTLYIWMEAVYSVITWVLGVFEDRTKFLVYFNKLSQPRLCWKFIRHNSCMVSPNKCRKTYRCRYCSNCTTTIIKCNTEFCCMHGRLFSIECNGIWLWWMFRATNLTKVASSILRDVFLYLCLWKNIQRRRFSGSSNIDNGQLCWTSQNYVLCNFWRHNTHIICVK